MALQSTTAIATITLQQASSTVTFSGIPNTYRDLILVMSGGVDNGTRNLQIAFNGDVTNSNYAAVQMSGTGSSVVGTAFTSVQTRFLNYYGYLETNLNALIYTQIFDYSQTNKHKTYLSRSNHANNGTAAVASRWANLSAINSVTLNPDGGVSFAAGSTFSLYGRIA